MSESRAEPPTTLTDPKAILLAQLAFYRATLLAKLDGLGDEQLRTSILPSGWAPLELLRHLVYVERRWMEWGFAGIAVPDPWDDHDPVDDRWVLAPGDSRTSLRAQLAAAADRTEAIAASATLTQRASTSGRFRPDQPLGGEEPPTLAWILAHLVQEYARHVGQLDVVRELLDGSVGE